MHFGWVSERIHNHFWSFCTRVDVAKRMNHILLKEIQEFLQERLFANSTIKTFIIFIVATNQFHFIASNLFVLLIQSLINPWLLILMWNSASVIQSRPWLEFIRSTYFCVRHRQMSTHIFKEEQASSVCDHFFKRLVRFLKWNCL